MRDVRAPIGRTLVLGAHGMLGRELMAALRGRCSGADDQVVGWDIADLDICNDDHVRRRIDRLRPALVVNAAAYTDVDGCERSVEQAMAVNAHAPGRLAEICRAMDATLVHFSTDFVFDGKRDRPYRPEDEPRPISIYGLSKWNGERAVREAGGAFIIIRTSWLFGRGGRNFVETILSRSDASQPLHVVTDQVGRPTFAVDLADAVVRLLDAGARGVVHFANAEPCSWHEFATEIVRQAGGSVPVHPTTSAALNRPAPRPSYSVLDTTRYVDWTGVAPPPWPDALRRYLASRPTAAATAPSP